LLACSALSGPAGNKESYQEIRDSPANRETALQKGAVSHQAAMLNPEC